MRRSLQRLLARVLSADWTDPHLAEARKAAHANTGERPRHDAPHDFEGLHQLDPQAITQIHNRFFPEIYRYAFFRLSDQALAEDITSETFVCLLEAIHAGKGPHTTLRGWLMRTVANLVNNHYRKAYARPTSALSETVEAKGPLPAILAEEKERNQAIQKAIAMLTPEQQHVLALRFGSSFSLKETASVLGKKANAIKAMQFRALAAIRRHLDQ